MLDTAFQKRKIYDSDPYSWTIVPYLCETTSQEFEFLHKSYGTTIAMAIMTFEYGVYFDFRTS